MRALLIVVLVAGCETGGPPDLSAQLIAHYPMDEVAAGTVADAAGNHNGMCTVCPTVEAGKVGMAMRFDGGDQQVDIPMDKAFDSVGRGFSAAAWIRLDMAPPQLPGCAAVKGTMWSICVTPGMHPAFGSFTVETSTLTVGEWHHIAISYDFKVRRLVVDGTEVGTTPASIPTDTGQIILGGKLIGLADDIRVYGGVLTDEEIAMLVAP